MSHAAVVAAIIIFLASVIALIGLPKHAAKDDDTI
jgi:hypothetical protein